MSPIAVVVAVPKMTSRLISSVGEYALFLMKAVSSMRECNAYRKPIFRQMVRIGVESLPVVMLASAFAGVVTTIQTAYQLQNVILSSDTIGAVVVPTLMLEMAALVPGLVLASRIGASITAEIGTMRVTEQIDALETMGMNSVSYLVLPRVMAGAIMFPSLYIAAAAISVLAGGYAGEIMGYLPFEAYIKGARTYFRVFDLFYGMTKMFAFGLLITSIACWKGFTTTGGADGVGRSTTSSVVLSCVNLLVADYIVAELLL
jgi:phospholipid/cholesterol/gamma-HCH transport system permease protein